MTWNRRRPLIDAPGNRTKTNADSPLGESAIDENAVILVELFDKSLNGLLQACGLAGQAVGCGKDISA